MTQSPTATDRYVIDPRVSTFSIRAFAGGVLGGFGHDPTFAVRDFRGEVQFDPKVSNEVSLTLTIEAQSLSLTGDVSEGDRRTIEATMHDEVLETARFPEIRYQCATVRVKPAGSAQYEVILDGELTLHGVTRRHPIPAHVSTTGKVLRAFGEFPLRQSDYDIQPVTVAKSMLKVKDELKCAFDIVARR